MIKKISKLSQLIEFVSKIKTKNILVFRGEKKDYNETALNPFLYREKYIENEDKIFRESQRFNNDNFTQDKTTFDRLSRIQHYSAPTRLIDVSEDLFSSVYFAIADKDDTDLNDAIIYIFEIDNGKVKYYDSDSVSVVSSLAKMPLLNSVNEKSKSQILKDINSYFKNIEQFNKTASANFLLHEIKEEKSHFLPIINPKDLLSVQFVLPKFTSSRVRSQKGAFLLFGLNRFDVSKPIKIIEDKKLIKPTNYVDHPILKIHMVILQADKVKDMKKELCNLGIRKSFIYPEIDKVSEYLKFEYKDRGV